MSNTNLKLLFEFRNRSKTAVMSSTVDLITTFSTIHDSINIMLQNKQINPLFQNYIRRSEININISSMVMI